jgi:iron(III) transport system ATP-binding protein
MTERTGRATGVIIEDLSISFGSTAVLKGINLTIEPGEFFTFLGPSGSGKSTLLRSIAGFGPTPSGRILLGDRDVARLPPWHRNVGMVFQSYALWPHMTVRRNVAFGLEERRVAKKDIPGRVDAALDMVGLLEYAERRPSQLSGGQQQRVALARTIVVEPQVLLLDEPLSNLDAALRVQMRQEILELQRKLAITTIFVTHDQEEANTTADRIAVIDDGIVQQVGAPMELYDQPANLFVAHFLGVANVIEGSVDADGGTVVFRSADGGITVPLAEGTGGAGSIVFRPQNLSIRPEDAAPISGAATLSGTVEYMEFLGGVVRYRVAVGDHSLLVDEAHQRGEPAIGPGVPVKLHFDAGQIIVLAR